MSVADLARDGLPNAGYQPRLDNVAEEHPFKSGGQKDAWVFVHSNGRATVVHQALVATDVAPLLKKSTDIPSTAEERHQGTAQRAKEQLVHREASMGTGTT
jgi:hypothetical protein